MMDSARVAKYLDRYACAEARQVVSARSQLAGRYGHVCAIPIFNESAEFIEGLAGAVAGAEQRCLFAVVVNATDRASRAARDRNAQLIAALTRRAAALRLLSHSPPMWLLGEALRPGPGRSADIVLVDRSTPPHNLDRDQGVGLARKIGCDIALTLMASGLVSSRWIHTTDADVILPARYFAVCSEVPRSWLALTYPFRHQLSGPFGPALALYELSLHYYVRGLAWAGSPYAHHTIGSTLAVDGTAYAAVRGVPRRQAGEDFYLLNKIAKVGPVGEPEIEPIQIHGRSEELPSARVPFGTGPATRRIAADLAAGQPFCLYHPRSFAVLRCWQRTISRWANTENADMDHVIGEIAAEDGLDSDEIAALQRVLEGQR
ncbi:MAG: hypothetical protein AAGC55_21590, partial [Myxococcota bacterium]